MLDFLNTNSAAIQAVTVVIMLLITWWYAYTTMKMAKIMRDQFNQSARPYLSVAVGIDRRFNDENPKQIQLVFNLKNAGSVPLVYSNTALELKGVSMNPQVGTFVLFPDQTTSIYSNTVVFTELNDFGQGEKGKIKITSWSSSNPRKKYLLERNFRLEGQVESFIESENFEELNK
jgi:hypothetical protein